jgi:hypothetical protein
MVKIYIDTDKTKVEEVHDQLSAHFELPKGRVKSYSTVIEYDDKYGFLVALSGNHDVSSLIDVTKVVNYTAPEPEETLIPE